MKKHKMTYLFCYDDHRGFSEDVRKRFSNAERYTVISYPTREEFLGRLEKEQEHNFCKVAILGVHETKDHFEVIDRLSAEVKKIDPLTGLILLCPPDKLEEVKESVKFNIDAYIPKNSNTVLRLHNAVKKIISEHSINIFRKRRNLSLFILLAFLLLSLMLIIIAHFELPEYF